MSDHDAYPQTIHAFASLDESAANAIKERDDQRLELEKSRVAPHIALRMTEPTQSLFGMMREWELIIVAMESGWRRSPQPLLDDYLFALDTRAALESGLREVRPSPPPAIIEALQGLDDRFLSNTLEEGPTGTEPLAPWLDSMEKRPPLWLWNRRPRVVPW